MTAGSRRIYEPQDTVTECLATQLASRRTVIGGPARNVHGAKGSLIDVVGKWANSETPNCLSCWCLEMGAEVVGTSVRAGIRHGGGT